MTADHASLFHSTGVGSVFSYRELLGTTNWKVRPEKINKQTSSFAAGVRYQSFRNCFTFNSAPTTSQLSLRNEGCKAAIEMAASLANSHRGHW